MLDRVEKRSPFYKHWLNLILAGISFHMLSNLWDEITYPFPNAKVIPPHTHTHTHTLYNGCNCLTMLGLKLTHVSERRAWSLSPSSPYKHFAGFKKPTYIYIFHMIAPHWNYTSIWRFFYEFNNLHISHCQNHGCQNQWQTYHYLG